MEVSPGEKASLFEKEYALCQRQAVQWGDMDAYGHVNNAVYFRYFENIRMTFFEQVGVAEYMQKHQVGPILASTQCRFRSALVHPDQIIIATRITELREHDLIMQYAVFSEAQDKLAAEGEGRVVYYDYRRSQKAVIPESLRTKMKMSYNKTD